MTITKSIDHFVWKFKNKWDPTPTDAEALNTMIGFVGRKA